MRIWLVNHYAIPPTRPGGTRHYSLARHLGDLGHEVTVIAATHGLPQSTGSEPPASGPESVNGVRFRWIQAPPYSKNSVHRLRNMIGFARGFMDWARTVPARERPEVVVGSSPHLIAAVAAGRASRLMGSKFVAEVRDIWPESLVDLGVSRWHPFVIWMGALERRLHGLADGLVTLLPKSVAYFEGRGVPRERICVVPNGIDLDESPTDLRREGATDGFTVVYAGAHGVANGLDTLLDAAKLLRNEPVQFQLYGDGPERPRLANRVKAEGIVNVELKGAVPKAEVHGALRSAGAGLLVLSKMDVFRYGISPNKLFDYLAMGLPVVVSVDADLGGLGDCPAVVQTPAGDGKALAEAVRLLSKEDPCERRARGDQGRAFVEAHHDFKVLARRYSEFLTQIVAGAVPQSTENLR